jgi:hypothetical protein
LRIKTLTEDMHVLLSHLRLVATAVRAGGGTISFEWPRYCSLWREPAVQTFIKDFQLYKVDFDGCAVGLVSTKGEPLLKPWRIFTDNKSILTALVDQRCNKQHAHGTIAGKETARTASYPPQLCILLHNSLKNAERVEKTLKPATFEELAAAASQRGQDTRSPVNTSTLWHSASSIPPGLSLPAGSLLIEPRPKEDGPLLSIPFPSANDLGRPLDSPVLFGIDPSCSEMGGSWGDAGYVAATARASSTGNLPSSSASGHRPKASKPTIPF